MSDFSPIANKTMRTSKSSSRLGRKPSRVIVHHWAGTGQSGINRLVHSADKASANYIIADGQIIGSVPESRRAWTSGSWATDSVSITVEVQNSGGAPSWPVSGANVAALTRLIADIADRYKWGKLTASHVRGHREFASTACPGPYLWPRLGSIRANAQALRGGKATPTPTKPAATTSAKKWPAVALPVTAAHTADSHNAWVQLMAAIGHRDAKLGLALQKWLRGLGYYRGLLDGVFGRVSVRALQTFLKRKGHYRGRIDGVRGPMTIRAEIVYLNVQRRYL